MNDGCTIRQTDQEANRYLCEAYEYLRPLATSPGDYQTLQRETFYGKEQAPLAYVIGLMNMILHGINAPNYLRTDTLADRIADFEEKDRYDVILANPPLAPTRTNSFRRTFRSNPRKAPICSCKISSRA